MNKDSDFDDDDLSVSEPVEGTPERNEIHEIQKMSKKETLRVRMWRTVVTLALLGTAVAITLTTYKLLVDEQKSDFRTAFYQFSRTVGDAAVRQQHDIRDAYTGFADTVSATARSTNATWPYFVLPRYESLAHNYLLQSGCEVVVMHHIVSNENREQYHAWAKDTYESQIQEGHMIKYGNLDKLDQNTSNYKPFVFGWDAGPPRVPVPDISIPETNIIGSNGENVSLALWHHSPPVSTYGLVNWNVCTVPDYQKVISALFALKNESVVTRVRPYAGSIGTAFTAEEHEAMHSAQKGTRSSGDHPHSFMFHPIHRDETDYNSEIVGVATGAIAWDYALIGLLPVGVSGIHAVIRNNCEQSYTYEIEGPNAYFIGEGDLHDVKYEEYEVVVSLSPYTNPMYPTTPGHCLFTLSIYPSAKFEESYDSNTPELFAALVSVTFFVVTIVFFIYDMFVQRRNQKLVENAARSNAVVSSMFPGNIRDKLIGQEEQTGGKKKNLKSFMVSETGDQGGVAKTKPLADLFLETTVCFADISGFTSWSSVREPSQVFALLEAVYESFDAIATRRRVFKVETVGDCYVAASGLPDPRPDHAVIMARFAHDIVVQMPVMAKKLETSLGPDTGELSIRVGMHSGPVTGGVLRGQRSRFQLFGDTMNTASRMESTSRRGCIQVSKATATLLEGAGKGAWLHRRTDMVEAKGKGCMETYWLHVRKNRSSAGGSEHNEDLAVPHDKMSRLIDWNFEVLQGLLKQIVARRKASKSTGSMTRNSARVPEYSTKQLPLEEVREIITLPEFDIELAGKEQDHDVEVPKNVADELRHLVSTIASMYNNNPFHNFSHASHVVQSVIKLMSRIVAPSHLDVDDDADKVTKKKAAASLHDHTYGITSDPLTQFACAFSALIHDVDHSGVSNAQLVKEQVPIAMHYVRSVAEQNSLELSWKLLMSSTYANLRSFLFSTQGELIRFRQLVVNAVMSTDIVDKELKELRNGRWDKAFKREETAHHYSLDQNPRDEVNRKATIVIEHIIQASDISHTMQHWHVYRKWNQNLFEELYVAYLDGRAEKDPAEFWYKGEFGFFDFYIIPLTKKLKECGVFGVSSGEYLNYALANRAEWELKGEALTAEMSLEARRKYGVKDDERDEEFDA